jgi:hypothetical protein
MSTSIELGVLFLYYLLVPGTPVIIHITSTLTGAKFQEFSTGERKKESHTQAQTHRHAV